MKGTSHLILGAASGYAVAYTLQTDPTTTMILVGLGSITGLLPDIDSNGKLSNKITFSHKFVKTLIRIIGITILLFCYFQQTEYIRWIGIGLGAGVIFLASFITQRLMLTLTSIGLLAASLYLQENWLVLLSIFMLISSFIPHRSYTHSLLGVICFGVIAYQFQMWIHIQGVFITCMLGYASHLIADMKVFPFNKRGVKWFLPFSKREY